MTRRLAAERRQGVPCEPLPISEPQRSSLALAVATDRPGPEDKYCATQDLPADGLVRAQYAAHEDVLCRSA